jgi:hypothetical protein
MIKNFDQWNRHSHDPSLNPSLNEGVLDKAAGAFLKMVIKVTGKNIDDLAKGGFKGIRGRILNKIIDVSTDEISMMEKGLADVLQLPKQAWWRSLSKESRSVLEKEADDIIKKYAMAYHKGDKSLINAARSSSNKYMEKIKEISDVQKGKNNLSSFVDDNVPGRKVKSGLKSTLDDAQKDIDDAIRTGDMEKLTRARRYSDEVENFINNAGKSKEYYKFASGRNGVLGGGLEDGANIADNIVDSIGSKGKNATINTLKSEVNEKGRGLFKSLRKDRQSVKEQGGIWRAFKKNLRRVIALGAVVYAGGVAWNYLKNGKQGESVDTVERTCNEIERKFIEEGVSVTRIDTNKASFSELFRILFAGTKEDLPIDDAQELKTMFNSNDTVSQFFAKTCQLSFEYPEKYFKDNSKKFKKSSKFLGFVNNLNEKIGVSKLINAVRDANGMAAQSLEETFFENGSPISLDEYGYASFANPNMKILLGSNEPVKMNELLEESKDFVSLMSTFRRKIMNDSIELGVESALKESGNITEEEFKEKSRRIEKELGEQLSEKEEAFVAITGMLLSYSSDKEPFSHFYKFDPSELYETVGSINSLIGENFDLQSNRQLSRMYMVINSEFSEVYSELGKERTLYGVMEYSKMGSIMRSIMNLYALEEICKIILSSSGGGYEPTFTKTEIEEYQKIIKQIQIIEGEKQTVVVSGVLDEETQEVIKGYQKKLGLPETGNPGEKSLRAMKNYLTSIVITKG